MSKNAAANRPSPIGAMIRTCLIAIAAIAACKSGKDLAVPTVAVKTVLANSDAKPPLLLILDRSGTARLAAAKTWADLDAHKLHIATRAAELSVLDKHVREADVLKRDPLETVTQWDELGDVAIDLRSLDDTTNVTADHDDPPPPEDPADNFESQNSSVPALGQWASLRNDDLPSVFPPDTDRAPVRLAHAEGRVMKNGKLDPLRAMIVVAPTANATMLIEAVRDTGEAIAVSFGRQIRPLHLQFAPGGAAPQKPSDYWTEVRVSATELVVEAVPDKPIAVTALDQLGTAMQQARGGREGDPEAVDVLVTPDISSQRLIDVVVAADLAGARTIGIGLAPSDEQLARRGHPQQAGQLTVGIHNVLGISREEISRVVKRARPKLLSCYDHALRFDPTLQGRVEVQFLIKADGTVERPAASGMSSEVEACVEAVVKSATFPKPTGGGSVAANLLFVFHR